MNTGDTLKMRFYILKKKSIPKHCLRVVSSLMTAYDNKPQEPWLALHDLSH